MLSDQMESNWKSKQKDNNLQTPRTNTLLNNPHISE